MEGALGPLHRFLAWVLVVALLAGACASRSVLPIGAGGRPFRPDSDERALWAQAEKEEDALLKRTRAYDDPLLEEYLDRIANRLMPDEVRAAGGPGVKVGVIRDATLNAFTMPNGRIFVHTGLLSRLDNEAQLATVLSHELIHYTHRHALKFSRDAQNKQTPSSAAAVAANIGVAAGSPARSGDQVGTAVLSQTATAVLGLGLGLATVAAIHGYGRDLEREADEESMAGLVRAGYDPREAPKLFQVLVSESGNRGTVETFFFGSLPRLKERITITTRLAGTTYASAAAQADRIRNTEDFDLRMRTVVRENAYEDIRLGRFPLAQRQLDRVLAITPADPTAHLYYGDLHRLQAQRAKSLDDKTAASRLALERYERAVELDPAYPDPWRQLGLLHFQQKDRERARAAFEKYIALTPDAADAGRIKEYLIELNRRP